MLNQYFTNLKVWQKSRELQKTCYELSNKFPSEEKYRLIDQIRRCAPSVSANIAEGNQRFHYKDKIRFFYNSRASLAELHNHIIFALDLDYIKTEEMKVIEKKIFEIQRMLNGLISSTYKSINPKQKHHDN